MTVEQTIQLTVVVLTKNSGNLLRRCLESAAWADELLVYDSGSSDETLTIAQELGARVVTDTDWQGFGRQRQKAQEHARGEWLFWLDSDEVISPELRQSIEQVLRAPERGCAYRCARLTDYFGRFIRHSGWYPDQVVRLHRAADYGYNDAQVHEAIDCPRDRVRELAGDLHHYTTESFAAYMTKSVRYADDWARDRYSRGKRVSVAGVLLRSFWMFVRKYLLQRGILDGKHGLLLAVQSTHYTFNKYFALWVLAQKQRQD
ncbi:glycosyltransferase family 2 protein [Motiliproteus sediminis]|uniref:glycosyltransferase family 2 protein n=1 Tax=Motiliproteus sediminis TaxID=1468178 RepID=UPI001AEF971B|nr:glycosyltransferase family 2 protein [Motiliproteus sediminis]